MKFAVILTTRDGEGAQGAVTAEHATKSSDDFERDWDSAMAVIRGMEDWQVDDVIEQLKSDLDWSISTLPYIEVAY